MRTHTSERVSPKLSKQRLGVQPASSVPSQSPPAVPLLLSLRSQMSAVGQHENKASRRAQLFTERQQRAPGCCARSTGARPKTAMRRRATRRAHWQGRAQRPTRVASSSAPPGDGWRGLPPLALAGASTRGEARERPELSLRRSGAALTSAHRARMRVPAPRGRDRRVTARNDWPYTSRRG